MFRIMKFAAAGVLLVGAIGTAAVLAQSRDSQQPDRKRSNDKNRPSDNRDPRQDRRGPDGPMGDRDRQRPDAAVEAWVNLLSEKMIDPHDTIRDSARAALVAVGPQALPFLRRMSGGEDGARAVAARKVIAMIESRGERRPDGDGFAGRPGGPMGPGRGPGFPGGQGMGPMGPGFPGGLGAFPNRGPGKDRGPGDRGPGNPFGPGSGSDRERGPGRDEQKQPPVAPFPGTPDGSGRDK